MRGRSGPVSESKFELKTLKVSNDTLNVSWNHPCWHCWNYSRLVLIFLIGLNCRPSELQLFGTDRLRDCLIITMMSPVSIIRLEMMFPVSSILCSDKITFLHCVFSNVWCLLSADDQLLCGERGGGAEEGGRLARQAHVQLRQEGLVSSMDKHGWNDDFIIHNFNSIKIMPDRLMSNREQWLLKKKWQNSCHKNP